MAKKTILHISDFDSKILLFSKVISLFDGERAPFYAKFNANNVYFFPIICSKY